MGREAGEPGLVSGWEADCEIGPCVRLKCGSLGPMGRSGKKCGTRNFFGPCVLRELAVLVDSRYRHDVKVEPPGS